MAEKPFSFSFQLKPDANINAIILEQVVQLHEIVIRQELLIGILLADRFPDKYEALIDSMGRSAEEERIKIVENIFKLYGS